MTRKITSVIFTLALAAAILITSLFASKTTKYAFGQSPEAIPLAQEEVAVEIDYTLPYPGRILPDHFLWPVKALRDKIWLVTTTNPLKKAEVMLLLADKRLVSARILFERKKPELAMVTLDKGEMYLEEAFMQGESARHKGAKTDEFLEAIVTSALKHRQEIEGMLVLAPGDAKPILLKSADISKSVFQKTSVSLASIGKEIPEDPFDN